MISDPKKLEVFQRVEESVDRYAYSRPSNITYPNSDDLSQEGKLAAWKVIQSWKDDNLEHMLRSSIKRGIGAMKDALRKANLVGPTIHNGLENNPAICFDAELAGDPQGTTLHDILPSDSRTPIDHLLAEEIDDQRINLLNIIDKLHEPWRYILLSRYYRKDRLEIVALNLGVSLTRVCQLEKQAVAVLKLAVHRTEREWVI